MALTIDGLTGLRSALGKYISNNQKEIVRGLVQGLVTTKYMTSMPKTITEYRASQASIGSIIQGFQKAWTPRGTANFTPIVITNRRHKIDLLIDPDDIVEEWIGWLQDESKNRTEWPITRYIIEKLVIPQVQSDRELHVLGKGVYEAPVEGEAQLVGKSCDGFITILEKELADEETAVNFLDIDTGSGTPSASNILDFVEEFTDKISYLYQSVDMNVFMAPELVRAYYRKDRATHGADSNFKGVDDKIYATMQKIVGLPSMAGTTGIFATPKSNFIHLKNANEGASRLFIDNDVRSVKLWADWWEAPGFRIGEAVFAAGFTAYGSGSGSGSASGGGGL